MRRVFFYVSLFLMGGFLYGLTEVLFRGYTHWSMFLLGGLCMLLIGEVRRGVGLNTAKKALLCGGFVTAGEFFCGMILNLGLHMAVWDYSDMPFNLWGQICLPYSAVWCLLSCPAMLVDMLHCRVVWRTEHIVRREKPALRTAEPSEEIKVRS